MNKELFYKAIEDPRILDISTLGSISEAVSECPYFDAGWMLLMRNLRNTESIKFETELRSAAAHVHSRRALYKLVNYNPRVRLGLAPASSLSSGQADNKVVSEPEQKEPEQSSHETVVSVEASTVTVAEPVAAPEETVTVVETNIAEPKVEKQPNGFVPGEDYFSDVSDDLEEGLSGFSHGPAKYTIDDIPDLVSANDTEDRTFGEWLSHINNKSTLTKQASQSRHKNIDLIEAFISDLDAERLTMDEKKVDATEATRRVERSSCENEGTFTATLAEIYVKQKQYDKAINIFRKLSLKNPEKSAYFATRIEEIEKLID